MSVLHVRGDAGRCLTTFSSMESQHITSHRNFKETRKQRTDTKYHNMRFHVFNRSCRESKKRMQTYVDRRSALDRNNNNNNKHGGQRETHGEAPNGSADHEHSYYADSLLITTPSLEREEMTMLESTDQKHLYYADAWLIPMLP